MPRKTPVKELQKEEPVPSSPLRRSSRISNNSPVPTKVVTRRNSASEASSSTPKVTRGRRSSLSQEPETSKETQAEKKKPTTALKTRRSSLTTAKDDQADEEPVPKTTRTRVSSVSKDPQVDVKKPTTRGRRSVSAEPEPNEETKGKITRSRSGPLSKKTDTSSKAANEKPVSSKDVSSSTPIKKTVTAEKLDSSLESVEEINKEPDSPGDTTVKKKKSDGGKIDFDLSVINEASLTEEEFSPKKASKTDEDVVEKPVENGFQDKAKSDASTDLMEKDSSTDLANKVGPEEQKEREETSAELANNVERNSKLQSGSALEKDEVSTPKENKPSEKKQEPALFDSSISDTSFNLQLSPSTFEKTQNEANYDDKENVRPKEKSFQSFECEPMDVDEPSLETSSPAKNKSLKLKTPTKSVVEQKIEAAEEITKEIDQFLQEKVIPSKSPIKIQEDVQVEKENVSGKKISTTTEVVVRLVQLEMVADKEPQMQAKEDKISQTSPVSVDVANKNEASSTSTLGSPLTHDSKNIPPSPKAALENSSVQIIPEVSSVSTTDTEHTGDSKIKSPEKAPKQVDSPLKVKKSSTEDVATSESVPSPSKTNRAEGSPILEDEFYSDTETNNEGSQEVVNINDSRTETDKTGTCDIVPSPLTKVSDKETDEAIDIEVEESENDDDLDLEVRKITEAKPSTPSGKDEEKKSALSKSASGEENSKEKIGSSLKVATTYSSVSDDEVITTKKKSASDLNRSIDSKYCMPLRNLKVGKSPEKTSKPVDLSSDSDAEKQSDDENEVQKEETQGTESNAKTKDVEPEMNSGVQDVEKSEIDSKIEKNNADRRSLSKISTTSQEPVKAAHDKDVEAEVKSSSEEEDQEKSGDEMEVNSKVEEDSADNSVLQSSFKRRSLVRTSVSSREPDEVVEAEVTSSSDERDEEKEKDSKTAEDSAILKNSFKRRSLGKTSVASQDTSKAGNNKDVEEMDSSFDNDEDGGNAKTKDETDNSFLAHSFRRRSKDRTSITLQETIKAGEEKEKCVSDRIHKVVDLFCAGLKNKSDVSINVSLEYVGQVADSEDEQSDVLEVSLVASDITEKPEIVVADNQGSKRRKICVELPKSLEKGANLSNSDNSIKSPSVVSFSDIQEKRIKHKSPKKQETSSEEDEAFNEEKNRSPKKKLNQTPFRSNISIADKESSSDDHENDESIEESHDDSKYFRTLLGASFEDNDANDITWKPSEEEEVGFDDSDDGEDDEEAIVDEEEEAVVEEPPTVEEPKMKNKRITSSTSSDSVFEAADKEPSAKKSKKRKIFRLSTFNVSEALASSGSDENAGKAKKKLKEKSKASDDADADKLKKKKKKQNENAFSESESAQLMRPETSELGKKTKKRKLANVGKSEDVPSTETSALPVSKKKKKGITDLREKLGGKKPSQQDDSPLKPSKRAPVGWQVTII